MPRGAGARLHSRAEFARRLLRFVLVGIGFPAVALCAGVPGYRHLAGLSRVDRVFKASMILPGMEPANAMPNDEAKIFLSIYAIFSGAVYPAVTAIILCPLIHRMMAVLHIQGQPSHGEDGA